MGDTGPMSSVAQPYPRVSEGDEVEDVKERLRMAIREARKAPLRPAPRRRRARAGRRRPDHPGRRRRQLRLRLRVARHRTRHRPPARGPRRARRPGAPARAGQRAAARLGGVRRSRRPARTRTRAARPSRAARRSARRRSPTPTSSIAPALAVDTTGARLGQGGGWYDRALEHLRPGVPVVALVFPEELYDARQPPAAPRAPRPAGRRRRDPAGVAPHHGVSVSRSRASASVAACVNGHGNVSPRDHGPNWSA